MKKRIFIVAPLYQHDHLWKVCSTTSKESFLLVYQSDNYEELKDFDDEIKAKEYATKKGWVARRGNVI